ncbi:MAG: glycogen synthase [Lutibacter sp.]
MKIFHISAECYPIAKVGGLADVVGALPKYQNINQSDAGVIMPFYNADFNKRKQLNVIHESDLKLGNQTYHFKIKTLKRNKLGFPIYFVAIPELLFTDYVYSYDDTNRFLAFQIAVLKWFIEANILPDIIHVHDHHVGLIPFMIQECYKFNSLKDIPTILTIHNAQYQGWFSHDKVGLIPEFNFNHVGLLDWNGVINPLAAAIKCAWRVTTVSPNYMNELMANANGLENLLNHEKQKCLGILNGIDTEVWNTETDNHLAKNYKISNNLSGKKANKKYLCTAFNLDFSKPLFVFIGRLVGEKGADLFPEIFNKILQHQNLSLLILGSGHETIEAQLNQLKENHKGYYNTYIGYNESLAHKIYAGADFLLMPSRVEPCGLNQMYALKYGTIPIVSKTGGLKDTVIDIDDENGFGICHKKDNIEAVIEAVKRAVKWYHHFDSIKKIRKKIMQIDHSWEASANEYITLYKSLKS